QRRPGRLVVRDELRRALHPGHTGANRALELAYGQWEAVDPQHDVEPGDVPRGTETDLVGHLEDVPLEVLEVDQRDRLGTLGTDVLMGVHPRNHDAKSRFAATSPTSVTANGSVRSRRMISCARSGSSAMSGLSRTSASTMSDSRNGLASSRSSSCPGTCVHPTSASAWTRGAWTLAISPMPRMLPPPPGARRRTWEFHVRRRGARSAGLTGGSGGGRQPFVFVDQPHPGRRVLMPTLRALPLPASAASNFPTRTWKC